MAKRHIEFVTDTATLCVFDIAALKHRLHDECDWWTVAIEELAEVNNGNVAFVGLGSDGKFTVQMTDDEMVDGGELVVLLTCPSGRVFIGAGEEVTADGLEPEALRGGAFLEVQPGTYRLCIRRIGEYSLVLHLSKDIGPGVNTFTQPVRI